MRILTAYTFRLEPPIHCSITTTGSEEKGRAYLVLWVLVDGAAARPTERIDSEKERGETETTE
nr:unnamed protein product [Digitaria exilis]